MNNLNVINSYDVALNISDNEYYINHTTKQYFLLGDYKRQINIKGKHGYVHPLAVLSGNDDYNGVNSHMCGAWRSHHIETSTKHPDGYEMVLPFFK